LNIALDLINGIGQKEEEFEKLVKEIKDKKEARDDIKKEVKQSEKKLDIIEAGITEAKKKPIELSSGQYKVGADLDEGRYKATNVGRCSNFVVHNSSGRLKVNTILGNDGFGSGDYVFYADDGDSIQTES